MGPGQHGTVRGDPERAALEQSARGKSSQCCTPCSGRVGCYLEGRRAQ